jgi:predicted alpha/beta-hydrolase family hydrolase
LVNPSELAVRVADAGDTTALVYAATGSPAATLILGHGAGAGQRSAFMVDFSRALATLGPVGVDVVTFNFLYTEQRRRIPDRAPALEACYRAVMTAVRDRIGSARRALFIGGKSMGGRIASQVAAADPDAPDNPDNSIRGLVLLGYPLHPPGRPDQRRDKHLPAIGRPMLVVQGSRDTFGLPAELAPVLDPLTPKPTLHVVAGGDHSFKLSRKDPLAQAALYDDVQRTIIEWIASVVKTAAPANRR